VGTSADGTNQCIDFSRVARDAGASAVMVSPPRMPTLNSDAVMRHFISLAEAVDLPIIIQDYPVISGYSMEPALLARIAREVPTARTIKMEDPPTPLKVARTLKAGEGIDLTILGGLGGVYLLEELISGASGTMTGFAYPEILVKVVHLFRNGDVEGAADTFYRFVPLMRFEFQEGIGMAIRKEMLRRRGVLSYAAVRPPGASLDEHTTLALDRLLHWIREKEKALWISV
jgi:4-hydroxy-tetrahydrodipicolinate synthase